MTFFSAKVLRRIASLPAHLAFHWTNQPAASAAAERRHRDGLRRNLFVKSPLPNEAAVVRGLERNGVFVTDLDSLGLAAAGERAITESGREVAARLSQRAFKLGDKMPDMITSEPKDLLRHPEIYRWGLNAVMLRIAEAYLREPVAYDGALVLAGECVVAG